ncbi:unnamed protein product [Calypogeia fissa]
MMMVGLLATARRREDCLTDDYYCCRAKRSAPFLLWSAEEASLRAFRAKITLPTMTATTRRSRESSRHQRTYG